MLVGSGLTNLEPFQNSAWKHFLSEWVQPLPDQSCLELHQSLQWEWPTRIRCWTYQASTQPMTQPCLYGKPRVVYSFETSMFCKCLKQKLCMPDSVMLYMHYIASSVVVTRMQDVTCVERRSGNQEVLTDVLPPYATCKRFLI